MEAPESDGESLAPLRFAFGGSRDPVALVAQTLDVASRLPAHAAGDTPAVLAAPLRAARKEQGTTRLAQLGALRVGPSSINCVPS